MAEGERRSARVDGGAELAGNRTTGESRIVCSPCANWRHSKRASGFPAYRVLDGECDNMIDAPQLVTTLRKGNRLGAVVKGFSESGKIRLAEAWEFFIAVDQARVGAVAGRCTKEFCQTSNKAIYRSVCVVEGEEV